MIEKKRPGRKRVLMDTLPVQVYMPREQIERVQAYADERGLSQSEAIRQLVNLGLESR